MADVSPEGTNGGGVTCLASDGLGGAIKVGDTGAHRSLFAGESEQARAEEKRLEEFEELKSCKVVPPLLPKRTTIARDRVAPWAHEVHSKWQSPHDVSARALTVFPRERIFCVVICSKHRPRVLHHCCSIKACAAPRGPVSLGEVCL